jgi:hypothetical protein
MVREAGGGSAQEKGEGTKRRSRQAPPAPPVH